MAMWLTRKGIADKRAEQTIHGQARTILLT